jgi:hypothetical protein
VLDDDRRLTDDLVAVAQHRDRRRRPQLGQLGAVEIALLFEDAVGDALLVERDQNLLAVEREGMRVEGCPPGRDRSRFRCSRRSAGCSASGCSL